MRKYRFVLSALALLAGPAIAVAAERVAVHSAHPYVAAFNVIAAAKAGDVNAQARLGWMYQTGRGVPQNYLLAAKWFRKAAEAGHGGAQFALGILYNKGQGVPQDYVLSYMWFNLSASQATGTDRDFKVRMRDALATKMTVAQVEAAQQMARIWYKSPGDEPFPGALFTPH